MTSHSRTRRDSQRPIDNLRESVKSVVGEVAESLTGERWSHLHQTLLTQASKFPHDNYLNTKLLEDVNDDLEALNQGILVLRSNRHVHPDEVWLAVMQSWASKLADYLLRIFRLEPGTTPLLELLAAKRLRPDLPSVEGHPTLQQLEDWVEQRSQIWVQSNALRRERATEPRTLLKLSLAPVGQNEMKVKVLDSQPKVGEPNETVAYPFTQVELQAVLKALDLGKYEPDSFTPEQVRALRDHGLLHGDRLHSQFRKKVGQRLYRALIPADVRVAFKMVHLPSKILSLQLRFEPEDVFLAQFPWELIHDGNNHLVPIRQGIELTRYITFAEPPNSLETTLPLRVLFVSPRPPEDETLPGHAEREALLEGLEQLQQAGQVAFQVLRPATWDNLNNCLDEQTFDIIHFDGHGVYARVCPQCNTAHSPNTSHCTTCGTDMSDVEPEGYLHFEDNTGHLDRISTADMRTSLTNSETRLLVLTACSSGVVEGVSVFNGMASGLIQAGIPAVVGMQAAVTAGIAVKFVRHLYESLAKGLSVPEAVNRGRLAIYRDKPVSWFMPVVYLRSSDDTYGQLFKI